MHNDIQHVRVYFTDRKVEVNVNVPYHGFILTNQDNHLLKALYTNGSTQLVPIADKAGMNYLLHKEGDDFAGLASRLLRAEKKGERLSVQVNSWSDLSSQESFVVKDVHMWLKDEFETFFSTYSAADEDYRTAKQQLENCQPSIESTKKALKKHLKSSSYADVWLVMSHEIASYYRGLKHREIKDTGADLVAPSPPQKKPSISSQLYSMFNSLNVFKKKEAPQRQPTPYDEVIRVQSELAYNNGVKAYPLTLNMPAFPGNLEDVLKSETVDKFNAAKKPWLTQKV
jgi:hypothetical protein